MQQISKIDQISSLVDQQEMLPFLKDESRIQGSASKIYFPRSIDEVVDLMRSAVEAGVPVTVRGAGTGLVAAAVPTGGWVLSTEKLNSILKVDSVQKTLSVQAGVRLFQIENALQETDLFYPPNPTESSASIGGTINTDASGSRAFAYGSTRKYIKFIKLVTARGEIVDIPRGKYFFDKEGKLQLPLASGSQMCLCLPSYQSPEVKSSAGYYCKPGMDLIDLIIGSEGTLGIVVEATLALLDRPGPLFTGLLFYNSLEEALRFVEQVQEISVNVGRSGSVAMDVRAIEFIARSALDFVREAYQEIISPEVECAILFEQELPSNACAENFESFSSVQSLFTLLGDMLYREKATWISYPGDMKHIRRIRDFRHSIPRSVNSKLHFEKMGTDLIVPVSQMRAFVEMCTAIPMTHRVPHAIWGHISKSQLHVNLLPATNAEYKRAMAAYKDLALGTIQMGGSVAAEHGIGKTKHLYLQMMYSNNDIDQMKAIKSEFDPFNILGRGNIFD